MDRLLWTYAVVAIFVELSAVAGVGAMTVPVSSGLSSGALLARVSVKSDI